MSAAQSKVKQLERELADLRKQYEADPKNGVLSLAYGRKEQAWHSAATYEAREREKALAALSRVEANAQAKARSTAEPLSFPQILELADLPLVEVEHKRLNGTLYVESYKVCPNCLGQSPQGGRIPVPARTTMQQYGERGLRCMMCKQPWKGSV